MNKKINPLLLLLLFIGLILYGCSISYCQQIIDETTLLVKKAPEWTLKDFNGETHSLSQILRKREMKVVVIEFIATRCPVSQSYDERMIQLNNEYKDKGVEFVGINSNCNPMESPEEMKNHATSVGINYPVLKDNNNVVADLYGAKVTPHIYLLDKKGIIQYVGRVDDNQNQERVKSQDLRNAIDALLEGKDVPVQFTRAFGCTIKRVKK